MQQFLHFIDHLRPRSERALGRQKEENSFSETVWSAKFHSISWPTIKIDAIKFERLSFMLLLRTEHEINCTNDTKPCPKEIELDGLSHVVNCEWEEDTQGYDFLQYLQLRET